MALHRSAPTVDGCAAMDMPLSSSSSSTSSDGASRQLLLPLDHSSPRLPSLKHDTGSCPRCHSSDTKFCYYNNHSLSQPRYYCKSCRRYWTKGGHLRDVPVGGGSRRNKRSKQAMLKPWRHSCSQPTSASLDSILLPHHPFIGQCSLNFSPSFHPDHFPPHLANGDLTPSLMTKLHPPSSSNIAELLLRLPPAPNFLNFLPQTIPLSHVPTSDMRSHTTCDPAMPMSPALLTCNYACIDVAPPSLVSYGNSKPLADSAKTVSSSFDRISSKVCKGTVSNVDVANFSNMEPKLEYEGQLEAEYSHTETTARADGVQKDPTPARSSDWAQQNWAWNDGLMDDTFADLYSVQPEIARWTEGEVHFGNESDALELHDA